MAAVTAPLLDGVGRKAKDVTLEEGVFAADPKPHLVHETVRAELASARAATRGGKSRGLVSGGRSKPWRQKGTGRARAGTTRAPHWRGGGLAFPPGGESYELKVNRKERKAAFRSALAAHAAEGTLALLDGSSFEGPSTRYAAEFLASWGKERPLVVVATEDEELVLKSFRNLPRVLVTVPSELQVSELVWARALLITEAALPLVERRASANGKGTSE